MYMHYIAMGTTTISLSNEAYKILKAQKMEGESFSDLILRKFGKGNAAAILAYIEEMEPLDEESAESIRKTASKMRKNIRLRRFDL